MQSPTGGHTPLELQSWVSNTGSLSQSLHVPPARSPLPLTPSGPPPSHSLSPEPWCHPLFPSLTPLLGPHHPTSTPSRTQIQTLRQEPLAEKQRVSICLGSMVLGGSEGWFRAGIRVFTSTGGDMQSV